MKKQKSTALPYDNQTTAEWLKTVEGWGWQKMSRGIYKIEGKCPRCKHYMSAEREFVTIISYLQDDESDKLLNRLLDADLPARAWVRCNCAMDHSGRPKGKGCGQAGEIAFANNIKSFDKNDFREDIKHLLEDSYE
jgi:hypothetical protein